jgi:hypothetical protein
VKPTSLITAAFILSTAVSQTTSAQQDVVGRSPWGPDDEIGTLNMMSDASRLAALSQVGSGRVYDLATEYFVGMPSFHHLHDPAYQYWLTHTPRGTVVDNPNGLGETMNRKVSYTGDAISLYTHMGTHIDALNHFGLNGRIWNGSPPTNTSATRAGRRPAPRPSRRSSHAASSSTSRA